MIAMPSKLYLHLKKHVNIFLPKNFLNASHKKAAIFANNMPRAANSRLYPVPFSLLKVFRSAFPLDFVVPRRTNALRSDIESIITAHNITKKTFEPSSPPKTQNKKSKPDSAPYRLALKNLEIIEPAKTVAIEDTPAGIQSAKARWLQTFL